MRNDYYLSEAEKNFFYQNGYLGPFTLMQPEEMTTSIRRGTYGPAGHP